MTAITEMQSALCLTAIADFSRMICRITSDTTEEANQVAHAYFVEGAIRGIRDDGSELSREELVDFAHSITTAALRRIEDYRAQ